MNKTTKISVIGLGKLGACYSAFYAERGYSVLGIDNDAAKVNAINAGHAPVAEPNLEETIAANHERLQATIDYDHIADTDVTFLIVPTPSEKNGAFSVAFITAIAKKIGPVLKKKKGYHLLVLVSTVLPENSRKKIIPAFEKYSGKKCGKDFGYCYSPSLIAIGDVLENLRHPDFIFIGAFDAISGDTLEPIYRDIHPDHAIERMSIESVELAKISLNAYVTMKITFANTLGEICEKIPHTNVDSVTNAIGKDKRIGQKFLRAGLGYGGPCFPRDNFAFANMAKKRGIDAPLALTTHRINSNIPARYIKLLQKLATKKTTFGFLGLSYKPKTTFTESSQAKEIAHALMSKKYAITLFEPLNTNEARGIFKDKISYSDSIDALIQQSNVLFVSNPDKLFTPLPDLCTAAKKKLTIVDPWGMFTPAEFPASVRYITPGRTPAKK